MSIERINEELSYNAYLSHICNNDTDTFIIKRASTGVALFLNDEQQESAPDFIELAKKIGFNPLHWRLEYSVKNEAQS